LADKNQAKIGVVSQVLARGGAISEAEARQLTDCVNTVFDGINFKYRRDMSHVARRVGLFPLLPMLGLFLAHVLGYYSSNSVTNLVIAMLDFFKDIFASFRQSSLERIKSPFLGAFVFSWVGFNWQMLAVLFMSKQSIIGRIDYINAHFHISNYLLGPISTTVLICLILPLANKHITKLQKSTNQDTNELILQSKIDIAEKQVELAGYEAKKKLAEEREKKNIEASIALILRENKRLTELSDA